MSDRIAKCGLELLNRVRSAKGIKAKVYKKAEEDLNRLLATHKITEANLKKGALEQLHADQRLIINTGTEDIVEQLNSIIANPNLASDAKLREIELRLNERLGEVYEQLAAENNSLHLFLGEIKDEGGYWKVDKDKNFKGFAGKQGFLGQAMKSHYEKVDNFVAMSENWLDEKVAKYFRGDELKRPADNNNAATKSLEELPADKAERLILNYLEDGGVRFERYMRDESKFPIEGPGISALDKRIMEALIKGSDPDPVVNALVNGYKKLDADYVAKRQVMHPKWRAEKGHKLPNLWDANTIQRDLQGWVDDMTPHIDADRLLGRDNVDIRQPGVEAEIKDTLFKIGRNIIGKDQIEVSGSFNLNARIFSSKRLVFKGDADANASARADLMLKYFKRDSGVFNGILNKKRQDLSRAVIRTEMGPDMGRTLSFIKTFMTQILDVEPKASTSAVNKIIPDVKRSLGVRNYLDDTQNVAVGTVNNIISGYTGMSALRNVVYDNSMHPIMVKAIKYKEGWLSSAWEVIAGTLSNAKKSATAGRARGLGDVEVDKTLELLANMGYNLRLTNNEITQGSVRKIQAASDNEKINKGWIAANRASNWMANALNKWTGANLTFEAARGFAIRDAHKRMMLLLDNGSFEDAIKGNKALAHDFQRFGINKQTWEVLKDIERVKNPDTGEAIGINISPDVDQLKAIAKKLHSKLEKYARPFEAVDVDGLHTETLKRIIASYAGITTVHINDLAPIPGVRGRAIEDVVPGTGWAALVTSSLGRFTNMRFTQFAALMRTMLSTAGYNPNRYGDWDLINQWKHAPDKIKVVGRFAQTAIGLTIGGIIIQQLEDIANGKTGREITVATIHQAMVENGLGGVAGWVYGNFMFNGDLINSPLNSLSRPLYRAGKAVMSDTPQSDDALKRSIYDAGKRALPVPLNMWWSKTLFKKIIKDTWAAPSPGEIRRMREEGNRPLEDWFEETF